MQFRSETPLRIATLFGHTAIITDEWRELEPKFHSQAIAEGAEFRDNSGAGKIVKPIVTPKIAGVDDRPDLDKVTDAIKKLLVENDPESFHKNGGLPKIGAVAKVAGFNVAKEDVMAAWSALTVDVTKAD